MLMLHKMQKFFVGEIGRAIIFITLRLKLQRFLEID